MIGGIQEGGSVGPRALRSPVFPAVGRIHALGFGMAFCRLLLSFVGT